MAAAAHAVHDRAHVQPIHIAPADDDAAFPLFVRKNAESGIHVQDFPVHAHHNGQTVYMPMDIEFIDADTVSVKPQPFGILKHFKKDVLLPFPISRSQKRSQHIQIRFLFQQKTGGERIFSPAGGEHEIAGILV